MYTTFRARSFASSWLTATRILSRLNPRETVSRRRPRQTGGFAVTAVRRSLPKLRLEFRSGGIDLGMPERSHGRATAVHNRWPIFNHGHAYWPHLQFSADYWPPPCGYRDYCASFTRKVTRPRRFSNFSGDLPLLFSLPFSRKYQVSSIPPVALVVFAVSRFIASLSNRKAINITLCNVATVNNSPPILVHRCLLRTIVKRYLRYINRPAVIYTTVVCSLSSRDRVAWEIFRQTYEGTMIRGDAAIRRGNFNCNPGRSPEQFIVADAYRSCVLSAAKCRQFRERTCVSLRRLMHFRTNLSAIVRSTEDAAKVIHPRVRDRCTRSSSPITYFRTALSTCHRIDPITTVHPTASHVQ